MFYNFASKRRCFLKALKNKGIKTDLRHFRDFECLCPYCKIRNLFSMEYQALLSSIYGNKQYPFRCSCNNFLILDVDLRELKKSEDPFSEIGLTHLKILELRKEFLSIINPSDFSFPLCGWKIDYIFPVRSHLKWYRIIKGHIHLDKIETLHIKLYWFTIKIGDYIFNLRPLELIDVSPNKHSRVIRIDDVDYFLRKFIPGFSKLIANDYHLYSQYYGGHLNG